MENYYQTALLISTFALLLLNGYNVYVKKKVSNELFAVLGLNTMLMALGWLIK